MKKLLFISCLLGIFFASCNYSGHKAPSPKAHQCWDEDAVFPLHIDADHHASFKGGDKALIQFIATQTNYPLQAKENGEQGEVFVRFVVEKDGGIRDVEVIRGVSKSLDEEAKRVVLLTAGKWNPATKNGEAVNISMTLPIYFQLN